MLTDRQINRSTDQQIDRSTDRQINRQDDTITLWHACMLRVNKRVLTSQDKLIHNFVKQYEILAYMMIS